MKPLYPRHTEIHVHVWTPQHFLESQMFVQIYLWNKGISIIGTIRPVPMVSIIERFHFIQCNRQCKYALYAVVTDWVDWWLCSGVSLCKFNFNLYYYYYYSCTCFDFVYNRDAKNMAKDIKEAITDVIQHYIDTTGLTLIIIMSMIFIIIMIIIL